MADLKLKIVMEAVNRITAPFKDAMRSSAGLKAAVGETSAQLKALDAASKKLTRFEGLGGKATANAEALQTAKAKLDELRAKMGQAGEATLGWQIALERAERKVLRLDEAAAREARELEHLGRELKEAGVSTDRVGDEQRRLASEITATTAKANQQAAALDRVARRAKTLADSRARMQSTQAMAGSMAGAGAAGLATGGAALAAGAGVAKVGIQFQAMMSKVGALARIDKTSEAFKKLEKQAEDLGAATAFSASQAAGAMGNLAMAGFATEEIYQTMPGMLDLAKAGGTELEETADIAANILRGFGLDASQMGDVGDVLTHTFTTSNTSLSTLGETMKYIAPVAKSFKYSLGDMAVMTGLLGNVGIKGSEAGTALRAMMARMAAPPAEAEKALAKLGVSTQTVAGDLRPMADMLADIAAKTKGMGTQVKGDLLSKIFGMEALGAAMELVEQGPEGIRKASKAMNAEAHGTAAKVAKQMADNLAGDLDELSSAAEGLNITLTKLNTGPLRELTKMAAGVVGKVDQWVKANPELAATLTRIAAGVAVVVAAGGALAIVIAGILGPFALMRHGITGLLLSAQPLGPALVSGVSALRAWNAATGASAKGGILSLSNHIRQATAAKIANARAALAAAGGWRGMASSGLTALTGRLSAAVSALRAFTVAKWQAVRGAYAAAMGWGRMAFGGLMALPGRIWAAITATRSFIAAKLMSARAALFTAAGWRSMASGGLQAVIGGLRMAAVAARGFTMALLANPIGLILAGIAGAALLVRKYWEPIAGFFRGLVAGIAEGFAPLAPVFDGIGRAVDVIAVPIRAVIGYLGDILTPVADVDGAAENMGRTWGRVIGGILTVVADLVTAIIGLPLKALGALAPFAADVTAAVLGPFDEMPGKLYDAGAKLISTLIQGVKNNVKALFAEFDAITAKIGGFFTFGKTEPANDNRPAANTNALPKIQPVQTVPVSAGVAAVAARPAATAAAAGPRTVEVNNSNQVTVYAAPGMDEKAVAQEVRRQLDDRDRRQRSAAGSYLYDK